MTTALALLAWGCFSVNAQTGKYWKKINENEAGKTQDVWQNKFKPVSYQLFNLNEQSLLQNLSSNTQSGKGNVIITVPDAEGNLHDYSVKEIAIMEPRLAAKYAQIKTYVGAGIDDASAVVHFSVTSSGISAVVTRTGKPTFYIDALDEKTQLYAVSARSQDDIVKKFSCSIDASLQTSIPTGKASKLTGNADDGTLRQYRLALCVNGEFSQSFLNGSETDTAAMKTKVMNALVICLQKANAVYERDFGVRLVYVNNEDTLIFLNPATDPWQPTTSTFWNTKTQKTIDNLIGKANYDIGHLLGKVPSEDYNDGNAYCIGCVCDNTQKGSGYTGYYDPSLTNYMVIDYWTHEMGHQFGANHTFTYSNEGSGANIEPGSGSTIMGYAGITGSTDVQEHSDDLFSVVSIAQNTSYIKSNAGGCAVKTKTGNTAPVANAGSDRVIPKSTPFVLTGTASDVNAADNLAYVWEQVDIFQNGSNTIPKVRSITGPLFRTYNYTNSTQRYFPDMQYILDGSLGWKWERLSATQRELNFRFTVRDNHVGGGNNKSDDVVILVDSTAGPFAITTQSGTTETWHGNETKTISWRVNNTDKAPVNCKKVNILLSTDGGITFSTVLAANTANDGSEDIAVPAISTQKARIKVEAADNIFFTINTVDFAIESVLPVTWLGINAQKSTNNTVLISWSIANEHNNKYYTIERSNDNVQFAAIGEVNALNKTAAVQLYNFTDSRSLPGITYYRIKQTDADGKVSYSAIAKIVAAYTGDTWSIQPNPARSNTVLFVNINLSNVSVSLYNAEGKQLINKFYNNVAAGTQINIPVAQYAKGVYFIKLNSAEETKTEKLIIE